ncbi:MAG: putative RNA methyltransferase [Pelotomaculaceae bacterium]|jgi:23S rRNA (guanine745-N1)-methyltransferase|nr:methyltransferase domain-containing protein [Bacillota bacterium]HHU87338.1 methyltransferase domain-containing protein [Peptococcaceae bacterium]
MLKTQRKKANANFLAGYQDLFRCPLCASEMKLVDLKSLICTNNHCYDLARQGYVNMLSHALKTKYNRQMFASRRIICRHGLFDPMINKIRDLITAGTPHRGEQLKILDAGCGEGSHLAMILGKVSQDSETLPLGVGLDISKDAIVMASKEYKEIIWCVGDLAGAPFAGDYFDFILNILAPANYAEFKRMISPHGRVIKVIPGRDYLKELRNILYGKTDKQHYSNDDTLELFKSNFALLEVERVRYNVTLEQTWLESLIQMTPLTWGTTQARLLEARKGELPVMTIDLTILAGEKHY